MPKKYFEKQKGKKIGFDMPMKHYGQGKSPFEFGFLKKALGGVKNAMTGPLGAAAGALFMKEENKKK